MTYKVGQNSRFSSHPDRANDIWEEKFIELECALSHGGRVFGVSILTGLGRVLLGRSQTSFGPIMALYKAAEAIYTRIMYGEKAAQLPWREAGRHMTYVVHGCANMARGAFEILQLNVLARYFRRPLENKPINIDKLDRAGECLGRSTLSGISRLILGILLIPGFIIMAFIEPKYAKQLLSNLTFAFYNIIKGLLEIFGIIAISMRMDPQALEYDNEDPFMHGLHYATEGSWSIEKPAPEEPLGCVLLQFANVLRSLKVRIRNTIR